VENKGWGVPILFIGHTIMYHPLIFPPQAHRFSLYICLYVPLNLQKSGMFGECYRSPAGSPLAAVFLPDVQGVAAEVAHACGSGSPGCGMRSCRRYGANPRDAAGVREERPHMEEGRFGGCDRGQVACSALVRVSEVWQSPTCLVPAALYKSLGIHQQRFRLSNT